MFKKLMDALLGRNGRVKTGLKRTVLVVDDTEIERTFITRVLKKNGYSVLVAEDGAAGFEVAQEKRPDLIILDYVMPGYNGKEVLRRLKRENSTKNIPVVFLTGSTTPLEVIECYEEGAEYYLNKPISAAMLVKQLELTFQEREKNRGIQQDK